MTDDHTHRAKYQRSAQDADQLELKAIIRGVQVFEAGISDDRISGAIQDIEDDLGLERETAQFQRQDLSTEEGAGGVHEEVLRRHRIMKDAYPFRVSASGIEYVPSASRFYEFCLAAACSKSLTKGPFVGFVREFERASATLVQFFLGGEAESLHVGKPRDSHIGTTFILGMESLAKKCGEFYWQPEEGLPLDPTTSGDEGVDFVVWRRMDDTRAGALFILCQCACGDDWLGKWEELNLPRLRKWFAPMTVVCPVRAFATPHHAVDGNLREGSRIAGLFFDRARLTLLAEKNSSDPRWAVWPPRLEPVSNLVLDPG